MSISCKARDVQSGLQNISNHSVSIHNPADSKDEEAIRLLLKECKFHDANDKRVHPTMISDNDGDLPLHFAASTGASPALLHMLTISWGDVRSALIHNNKSHLPIDDFIEWYIEDSSERYKQQRSEREASSGSESEDDGSDSSCSDNSSTKEESDQEMSNVQGSRSHKIRVVVFHYFFLNFAKNWERDLWDPMWILIQSAAMALTDSVYDGKKPNKAVQLAVVDNAMLPIHATVMVTKHFDYPALALVACMLVLNGGYKDETKMNSEVRKTLLEQDSNGYLPIHWACGDIHSLLQPSGRQAYIPIVDKPKIKQNGVLARFNTTCVPCTMIEWLLSCEPSAARTAAQDGRLPLHLLVGNGEVFATKTVFTYVNNEGYPQRPWYDIELMLKEYPEALSTPDPSRLYPFQVAAASPYQTGLLSLENTFRLIMEDASLLCQLIES